VPVLGIIEVGADLIMERWRQLIEAQVVLFAAPTTIRSGAYSRALTDRGLPADRLTSQIGGELIGLIERSAQGKEARTCVRRIVGEALDRVPDRSRPVIASLNCTHFTFVADQFKEAFRERGITPAALIAPDSQMVERFVRDLGEGSYETCDVTARVISQVAIGAQERDCIGRLIRWRSPQTAQALETYQLIPDLFRTAGVRSSR
jgi:glutamate racemase